MTITARTITLDTDLVLTVREDGQGDPVVVLHGGAGPASVTPIITRLAETHHVLAPTHPGWDDTVRPSRLHTVAGLATTYLQLLEHLGLRDVTVLGSSFGGWVAADMSTRDDADRISRLVLLGAIGPRPEDHHLRLAAAAPAGAPAATGTAQRHTPAGRGPSPADLALLQAYTGPVLHDPTLRERLAHVPIPALVVWGEQDPVVSPEYGRAYADAFPHARFIVIAQAGHLPTSEAAEPTFTVINEFLTDTTNPARRTA